MTKHEADRQAGSQVMSMQAALSPDRARTRPSMGEPEGSAKLSKVRVLVAMATQAPATREQEWERWALVWEPDRVLV